MDHIDEVLDYRSQNGVAEYLVRLSGPSAAAATSWQSEAELMPGAAEMLEHFQTQRAHARRDRKQRLPPASDAHVEKRTSGRVVKRPDAQPAAAALPVPTVAPATPTATRTPGQRLSAEERARLSAVEEGWLDRFVSFFSSRLSRSNLASITRSVRALAAGSGVDFGGEVGVYFKDQRLRLDSDVPGMRQALAAAQQGLVRQADQTAGGWKFSHPLSKLAEFQV